MVVKKTNKKSKSKNKSLASGKHPLIVKRKGHYEKFDERKIYASCYSACLGMAMDKKEAEKLCEKATRDMKAWLKGKKHVNSQHLFEQMVKILTKYNQDAGFMYETHRDIS